MKNVYCISNKQHGSIKSGIMQSKNSTISQVVHASALSGRCKSKAIRTSVWKWLFWAFFTTTVVKLHQFVINCCISHIPYVIVQLLTS